MRSSVVVIIDIDIHTPWIRAISSMEKLECLLAYGAMGILFFRYVCLKSDIEYVCCFRYYPYPACLLRNIGLNTQTNTPGNWFNNLLYSLFFWSFLFNLSTNKNCYYNTDENFSNFAHTYTYTV